MSASRGEGLERVEREILGEKAAALGRAGERLEQALAEPTRAAAALHAANEPTARQPLAADYEEARTRAARARLMLLIQREPPSPTTERGTEPRAPRAGHPRSEPGSRTQLQ